MLKIPSKPENKYNALTVFSIPKSYLDKKLQFFMAVKDEREGFTPFPNAVAATTGGVDAELKKMHFASPPSSVVSPHKPDPTLPVTLVTPVQTQLIVLVLTLITPLVSAITVRPSLGQTRPVLAPPIR